MVAKTANETINSLLDEMRPLLLIAGVPKEQIRVRSGKPQIQTLSRAFDWLHDLKMSLEYRAMVIVWKLLPESTWKRYDLYQITGLREQELLKTAKKKLLKLWKTKRPSIFNKDKKRLSASSSRVSIRDRQYPGRS